MLSSHYSDFSLFEVPNDPSRPEVRLASYNHPWLSCRELEITSPGLEKKNFVYEDMVEGDHKPVAKIFIKKWIFSPQRLPGLFKDPPALKILFAQAQIDVKNSLIFPTGDEKAELRKMALEGNAKEVKSNIRIPNQLRTTLSSFLISSESVHAGGSELPGIRGHVHGSVQNKPPRRGIRRNAGNRPPRIGAPRHSGKKADGRGLWPCSISFSTMTSRKQSFSIENRKR